MRELIFTFLQDEDEFNGSNSYSSSNDRSFVPADSLSIPEVFDIIDGKIIDARDFFRQDESELILWRRTLQEDYLVGRSRLVCPECKQPVKISGRQLYRGRVCFFSHFKDSDDCPYKTGINKSKEEIERQKYSLVQESLRHKRLKAAISAALSAENSRQMGVTNVECEKRIDSNIPYLNWRRPDVYAEYNGRKLVFELQLSTTFISVIVDRDIFYRLNDYNIIWVFNFDDNQEYVNLHNLMCKDIYYANKRNIFIFDDEAELKSLELGQLVLKCRWLDEDGKWSKDQFVTLDQFLFDSETNKPYIVDADQMYLEKHPHLIEHRKKLEHSREDLLNALMERKRQEEEQVRKKSEELSLLQNEIWRNGETVERFQKGTKYGYKYGDVVIVPPKYSSADVMHGNYAKVGFNRMTGAVRRDGKEIFPPEYKTISFIDDKHGILMAAGKRIELYLAGKKILLVESYDDKVSEIIEKYGGGLSGGSLWSSDHTNLKVEYYLKTKRYSLKDTYNSYGEPISRKVLDGYDTQFLFSKHNLNEACRVQLKDRQYLLSNHGKVIIEGRFSDIKLAYDEVYVIQDMDTGLWGVVKSPDEILVECKFAEIVPTDSEDLIVKYDKESELFGMIDCHGNEFITPKFKKLRRLNSERFAFSDGDLWGVCDRYGSVLHNPEYTIIKGTTSGSIMASTLNIYKGRQIQQSYGPSYSIWREYLCMLNDKGDISYDENVHGKYIVRHSGDLYSICSSNGQSLVDYTLISVSFLDDSVAIVKDLNGRCGIFINENTHVSNDCVHIERLFDDVFMFMDASGKCAIGNHHGPISKYQYDKITGIDAEHFIASMRYDYYYGDTFRYCIINQSGEILSDKFERIGEFENGVAKAVLGGVEDLIDISGHKLERFLLSYGELDLYESFGCKCFRNKSGDVVFEAFKKIEPLYDAFYVIETFDNGRVKLFESESGRFSAHSFISVRHLTEDLFAVHEGGKSLNPFSLYKGFEPLMQDSFSSIRLLSNGYFAVEVRTQSGYCDYVSKSKILKNEDFSYIEREFNSIIEADQYGFKVSLNGSVGKVDFNGQDIIDKKELADGLMLTETFGKLCVEDTSGNVIISFEEGIKEISRLGETHIKMSKDGLYALYDISCKRLTDYIYSDLYLDSDQNICAVRKGCKGKLDSYGKRIPELEFFDGGYIRLSFGVYSVHRDSNEVVFSPGKYTKITLLGNEGVFALWKGNTLNLGNKNKEITDSSFKSAESLGNGYYSVSNSVLKRRKILHTRWGKKYYTSETYYEDLYGIVDSNLNLVFPCRYSSISKFDEEGKITIVKANGDTIILTLEKLREKNVKDTRLSVGTDYSVKVKSFLSIGLIVSIAGKTYIVHKKYLYKNLDQFKKGESFYVRYMGEDTRKHPIWQTAEDENVLKDLS